MDYFIEPLKKYADFQGREGRQEYWMFLLICLVANIIFTVLGLELISLLVGLGLLIPSVSIMTRRLHDTGRSGWWQLIVLIPLVGIIVLIFFLAQDGQDDNDYGIDPKSAVPA